MQMTQAASDLFLISHPFRSARRFGQGRIGTVSAGPAYIANGTGTPHEAPVWQGRAATDQVAANRKGEDGAHLVLDWWDGHVRLSLKNRRMLLCHRKRTRRAGYARGWDWCTYPIWQSGYQQREGSIG